LIGEDSGLETADTLSVFGLGKLGATMAACFAYRGFNVIGVDVDPKAVDLLNSAQAPVLEPGLTELIASCRERLSATTDAQLAVLGSQVSFVIVPTPSDQDGSFSLEYLCSVMREIGHALAIKEGYHLVVVTSTVMPGATSRELIPLLEEASGKKCGVDFGVCYSPEFIALGSVIRDFLNPDFYLVGEFDERSGAVLCAVNDRVSENSAPVKRLSIENAELAKIAINSYVTLKISFANMLADFCEKIPGGNVDEVAEALGLDQRIGRKYLTGGLGFAGPCFPRDNVAFGFLGEVLDVDTQLLRANHDYNSKRTSRVLSTIEGLLPEGTKAAVLGLSYKPHSNITEWAPGIEFCELLADRGLNVVGHDVLALSISQTPRRASVSITDNLRDALEGAETIIVATPDPVYRNLLVGEIAPSKKILVLDCWRVVPHLRNDPIVDYWAVGENRLARDLASNEGWLV